MRNFKSRVQPGGALFALMFAATVGAQSLDTRYDRTGHGHGA